MFSRSQQGCWRVNSPGFGLGVCWDGETTFNSNNMIKCRPEIDSEFLKYYNRREFKTDVGEPDSLLYLHQMNFSQSPLSLQQKFSQCSWLYCKCVNVQHMEMPHGYHLLIQTVCCGSFYTQMSSILWCCNELLS